MALTKISGGVINTNTSITAVGATFSGNVSVAGTLTYEDVTNIDSVGLITARSGIEFGTRPGLGASISDIGNAVFAGVVTATSYYGDGSSLTGIDATQIVTGNTSVQTVDTGSDGHIKFNTEGTERARFDSSGRFGLGTTSVNEKLHISGTGDIKTEIATTSTGSGADVGLEFTTGDGYNWIIQTGNVVSGGIRVYDIQNNSERLRVDSSGRLLVGASTNRTGSGFQFQVEGTSFASSSGSFIRNENATGGASLILGKSRGTTDNSYTIVQSGDTLGTLQFTGADGSTDRPAAYIQGFVDGTPGSADMPGRLVFSTTADGASGPTERMRIDNYGRLLAGTTAPSGIGIYGSLAKHMFVTGGASIDQGVVLEAPTGYGNNLTFRSSEGAVGSNTLVNSGKSLGAINWYGTDGTYAQRAVTIDGFVDTTPGANDMPGSLQIAICDNNTTSVKPRFRIYHNGELNTFSNDNCIMIHSVDAGGTTYNYLFGRRSSGGFGSGTNTFAVRTNGNVVNTNNSYGSLSDVKLKENIVDSGSQWDDVKALRIRKYNFKADTGQDTHTQLGVIAQEVELVSPGLVYETSDTESINAPVLDEDGNPVLDANNEPTYRTQERELGTVTKNVNYSVLYMKAVKALQEAMTRIETLEAKVAALEAQ